MHNIQMGLGLRLRLAQRFRFTFCPFMVLKCPNINTNMKFNFQSLIFRVRAEFSV